MCKTRKWPRRFCLLQSLIFSPRKYSFWARIHVVKCPLPSLEAFLLFLHIFQSVHQLSGKTNFQHTSIFETLCCVTCLYHAQYGWILYVSGYPCNLLKSEKKFPSLVSLRPGCCSSVSSVILFSPSTVFSLNRSLWEQKRLFPLHSPGK